ncbi:restriction endonuclease subunit S domain-containing protein [Acinetobacter indicus]|uniref:restriction endonuclease subunit S n=1 Tax=Acinetobacter indicus TaxID=756892 RepID=UPI000CECD6CF|nr:restriction endonuclease subunit S [Acinetobacter indicus]
MATIFKRAPAQLSERRIDPWHYQPNFEKQIGKIEKNLGALSLDEIIEAKRGVAGGATPLGANYLENGRVKFYRTSEVEEMFLQAEDAVFISDEDDEKLKRSRLVDGDVLLTITGAKFGKSAVVSSKHLPGNISQHSVRFKPDPKKIDAHFLVAFLNGKTGQITIWREAYGATRPAIDFPSVRSLVVPKVLPIAQKYIGDKVRQAEQLRAWAKRLEDAVYRYHSQFIPDQEHLDFNKKTRMVSVKRMTERLDAHFYPGVVEQYLIAHPGKFESVSALTSAIYNGQTQPESSEEFCEQITVAHLSASFVKGQPRKVKAPAKNNKFVKPHDILMCNAAHNKSYIGRDLTYVHTDKELLPSTEVMTIRIDRDQVPASYVRAYLLSRLGYVKIQSTIRGITAHSYPDDVALLDIYIPEVEPRKKEEWFKQDDLLVQAGFAVELAQLLTSSAKTLVEALIEGQLTEQQLIQAQQALDDGDNSLDQAILSQLSNEGYAIEGAKPLFSDIDELYRLLESAAQAEEEE